MSNAPAVLISMARCISRRTGQCLLTIMAATLIITVIGSGIVRQSFKRMAPLWSQSLYVRALGNYLVETARRGTPAVKEGVERVLTITYKDDEGKEQVINSTLT